MINEGCVWGTFQALILGTGENDIPCKGSDIKTWIWLMKTSKLCAESATFPESARCMAGVWKCRDCNWLAWVVKAQWSYCGSSANSLWSLCDGLKGGAFAIEVKQIQLLKVAIIEKEASAWSLVFPDCVSSTGSCLILRSFPMQLMILP